MKCQYRVDHIPAGSYGAFHSWTARCKKNANVSKRLEGGKVMLCGTHAKSEEGIEDRPLSFFNCPIENDSAVCTLTAGHGGFHKKET